MTEEDPNRTIDVHVEVWIPGTRIEALSHEVDVEIFRPHDSVESLVDAIERLFEAIRADAAQHLSVNAVVALEIEMDPFAEFGSITGLLMRARGRASVLSKLFT